MTLSPKRIVHIFGQTPHHYLPMFRYISQFSQSAKLEQEFWAWSKPGEPDHDGIFYYPDSHGLMERMKSSPAHVRFVFHGLFDRSLWPKLLMSRLPSRCSWICWGAELHQHRNSALGWKRKVMYFIHRCLTKRFCHVVSLNKGDGELIRRHLANVKVEVLPYPLLASNSPAKPRNENQPLKILVGNSANPSNEHLDILARLAPYSAQQVEVIAPLNYAGSEEYVSKVIETGKQHFGDKFTAITQMLDQAAYDDLLSDVDIVVFGHKRQQGLYVVYSQLKHGRKLYVRECSTTYKELQSYGFDVSPTEQICDLSFERFIAFDPLSGETNKSLMLEQFSEEGLAPKWKSFLNRL